MPRTHVHMQSAQDATHTAALELNRVQALLKAHLLKRRVRRHT